MADPLSISASVAGLITIADIVIRNGYKYVRTVKDADKAAALLVHEVNSLSGTLHSLRNIAESLEGDDKAFKCTTQAHHIESCFRTLKKINDLLDNFEEAKAKGPVERIAQRLKWPLTQSETKSLISEITRHRETLSLALNADELSSLIVLLARTETMQSTIMDIQQGIEDFRKKIEVADLNKSQRRMLEWLCPARSIDPSRNQESAVALRQPGTGVWFTDSIEFQEWKLHSHSKLWLHGIPGAGKTILMSTIIQAVEKELDSDEGFAFFYCDYKDSASHQPSNILGSLIQQLALQCDHGIEILTPHYQLHSHPAGTYRSPNSETLLKMLHDLMGLFPRTTILIDGLDEISIDRRETVELLSQIPTGPQNTRTLFASRSEIDIEQNLEAYHQVSILARSSDLELYVASEIEHRTRKKQLNIKDQDLKEKIMRRLIHGAEGMFRWVACQIDHLCELPNDRARSKALDNLPRGLPETYERILSRILDHHDEVQDLVSRTLTWLVWAKRELEPLALLEAISLSPGDTSLDPDALVSEDDILRWCSSLLRRRANGEGIELAHFTVKEYLLSITSDKDAKFSKFNVQKDRGDLIIGRVCLTYLNMDCLGCMRLCATREKPRFEEIAEGHVEEVMEDSLVFELSCKLFSVRKSYNFVWWTYGFLSGFFPGRWWEDWCCDLTPLHWAALLRIPGLCQWLISQGIDTNQPSALGSSLDCAIMGTILLNQFNEEELLELGDNTGDYDIDESLICTVTQLIQGGADLNQVSCPVPRYSSIGLALLTCPYDKLVLDLLLTSGALVTNSTLSLIEKYLHINLDLNLDLTMISISVILSDSSRLFVVDSAMSTFERLSAFYNYIVGDTKGSGIDRSSQPLEDIELVEDKFLFDAWNGICKDIFSSILSLRKHGSPESEKTLTRGLCLALEYNHQNVVKLLLENKVSTTLVDETGASIIHKILGEYPIRDVANTIRDIKNLIDHGADLTSRDKTGRLAIHLAAASQHVLLTKEIIQHMGPETIGKELAYLVPSILECAVRDGSDENAIFALHLYHDINPTDHESEDGTPLMGLAASRESDIILRLLSRRGLSMEVIGKDGSSVLFQAARSIHEAPFNYLMEVKATDNSTRSDGRRAIHEAVTNDYDVSASKLSALLRAGEDPNIRCDDGSPLELTVSDKVSRLNKLELLLSHEKIDVNARNDSGATILMEYLGWGYNNSRDSIGENKYILSSMKLLISHEVDMNLLENDGRTALHYLCSEHVTQTLFDLLKFFVNSGASLCTKNSTGVTAFELLFVRCFSRATYRFDEGGRLKVLEYIIDNALEVLNNHLSCGMTPLAYALDNRSFLVASLLLAKDNLDVDIRDLSKWPATAVDRAAWRGCTKILARDLLARTKIPIDSAPLEIGYSLLHLSSMGVNSSIFLQELLQQNVDLEVLSSQGYTPLQIAVRSGSLAAVESLIKAGGIFKAAVGNPPTFPLHLAARDGRLPIVRLLIEAGADLKACSLDSKSTILHYASTAGSWELIQYLIDLGCTTDEKDINGMTPYLNAASVKNWDLVRKYTTVGVNVHATNNLGFGALHFAILRGSLPTVRFLLEKYPSLQRNIVDREGKLTGSALTISLTSGSIDLFNLFWKEGSDQFVSDNGDGIAHFAMHNGCSHSLRTILLTHEINWNLNTGYLHSVRKLPALRGLLPLHVAAAMRNDLAIKFLDNHRLFVDINTLSTGQEGYAALHIAAYCNSRKTIQLLLELGARIDIKSTSNGRRPLHLAARDGCIEAVTELLNSSCDPNPLDDEGLTPELLAIENNQHEVAKVLGAHLDSLKVSQNSTGSDGSDNDDTALEKTNISGSWRLPLLWSPQMRNVLTEEFSIYAVKNSECPEELRNALAEGKDKGVYHLGRPQVRRI